MEARAATWLVGLRRAHLEAGALDRYVEERGVTGAVWLPAAFAPPDYALAVVRLVEAGARPDASLLWDLAVPDVREAADVLRHLYRAREGADGLVAVWADPGRLSDPGRAAAHALQVRSEVRRENVAVAFAWAPARAGALSAVVGAGIPVALSGVRDEGGVRGVLLARERGMERRRRDDPEAEEVRVFLLGGPPVAEGGFVHSVGLVHEVGVLAPGRGPRPRLPASQDEERTGQETALRRLARVAAAPPRDDAYAPEGFAHAVEARCADLERRDVGERIWARDHTLWSPEPAEVADRLGWLDVPFLMREAVGDLESFAGRARAGASGVLLLGMGGSSLGAELLAATLPGPLPLTVLDSTHPRQVAAVREGLDLARTLFVVASKSGTTVETLAHLEYFWSLVPRGERWVAVTDPGTPLAELASDRGFLRVFENPPDIGGRYSALSCFGLVPAALCGVDVRRLLEGALEMVTACAGSVPAERNPGVRLGAALADAAGDGRDKLTLVLPPPIRALGPWVEQLVAESTGKGGRGILPVEGEDLGPPDVYGPDRLFVAYAVGDEPHPPLLEALEAAHPVVRLRLREAGEVGAELFRWELATAVAGHLLGVNPFDQPDVEATKRRTREALGAGLPPPEPGSAAELLEGLEPPAYVAIQAFLPPTPEHAARLQAVRLRLRERLRVAVTVGFGPRFLHSTGQLHKGGPPTGVFLQVTGGPDEDLQVPGAPYTFGQLLGAQADGDLVALREAGRRVARVSLEDLERLVP